MSYFPSTYYSIASSIHYLGAGLRKTASAASAVIEPFIPKIFADTANAVYEHGKSYFTGPSAFEIDVRIYAKVLADKVFHFTLNRIASHASFKSIDKGAKTIGNGIDSINQKIKFGAKVLTYLVPKNPLFNKIDEGIKIGTEALTSHLSKFRIINRIAKEGIEFDPSKTFNSPVIKSLIQETVKKKSAHLFENFDLQEAIESPSSNSKLDIVSDFITSFTKEKFPPIRKFFIKKIREAKGKRSFLSFERFTMIKTNLLDFVTKENVEILGTIILKRLNEMLPQIKRFEDKIELYSKLKDNVEELVEEFEDQIRVTEDPHELDLLRKKLKYAQDKRAELKLKQTETFKKEFRESWYFGSEEAMETAIRSAEITIQKHLEVIIKKLVGPAKKEFILKKGAKKILQFFAVKASNLFAARAMHSAYDSAANALKRQSIDTHEDRTIPIIDFMGIKMELNLSNADQHALLERMSIGGRFTYIMLLQRITKDIVDELINGHAEIIKGVAPSNAESLFSVPVPVEDIFIRDDGTVDEEAMWQDAIENFRKKQEAHPSNESFSVRTLDSSWKEFTQNIQPFLAKSSKEGLDRVSLSIDDDASTKLKEKLFDNLSLNKDNESKTFFNNIKSKLANSLAGGAIGVANYLASDEKMYLIKNRLLDQTGLSNSGMALPILENIPVSDIMGEAVTEFRAKLEKQKHVDNRPKKKPGLFSKFKKKIFTKITPHSVPIPIVPVAIPTVSS